MPHLIVEYSANLEHEVDIPHLVSAIHAAALDTGVFPIGGIRTRAVRREIYQVADGHPDNGFIHLQARIGKGRTPDVREKAQKAQRLTQMLVGLIWRLTLKKTL